MAPALIEKWDFEKLGLMTLDRIREMFTPLNHFRVSRYEYPVGTTFSGASRANICYVLEGRVTYRFEACDFEISLSAGEFARLPSGTFCFLAGNSEPVLLVNVWELPAELWPN
jgi:mannose-6-phosphate isomerase class I